MRQSHQVLTKVHYIYSGHHLEHRECTVSYAKQPSKVLPLEAQYVKKAESFMTFCFSTAGHTHSHTRRGKKKVFRITQ